MSHILHSFPASSNTLPNIPILNYLQCLQPSPLGPCSLCSWKCCFLFDTPCASFSACNSGVTLTLCLNVLPDNLPSWHRHTLLLSKNILPHPQIDLSISSFAQLYYIAGDFHSHQLCWKAAPSMQNSTWPMSITSSGSHQNQRELEMGRTVREPISRVLLYPQILLIRKMRS